MERLVRSTKRLVSYLLTLHSKCKFSRDYFATHPLVIYNIKTIQAQRSMQSSKTLPPPPHPNSQKRKKFKPVFSVHLFANSFATYLGNSSNYVSNTSILIMSFVFYSKRGTGPRHTMPEQKASKL